MKEKEEEAAAAAAEEEEEEAEGHQAEAEAGGGLGPLQLAVASLWPVAGAAEGGGHRLDAEYLTLTLVCFHG